MRRRLTFWSSVFVLSLLSSFLWIAHSVAAETESVKVHSPSFDISVIPLYIAKDKGYFREQGLEPAIVLAADNIGILALIAGEFDFSASATGASTSTLGSVATATMLSGSASIRTLSGTARSRT